MLHMWFSKSGLSIPNTKICCQFIVSVIMWGEDVGVLEAGGASAIAVDVASAN